VELGKRVDGAQPGVELTELSRNHANLFSYSFNVVDLDPGGSVIFFLPVPYPNPFLPNVKLK
jgi:hypothetical protein